MQTFPLLPRQILYQGIFCLGEGYSPNNRSESLGLGCVHPENGLVWPNFGFKRRNIYVRSLNHTVSDQNRQKLPEWPSLWLNITFKKFKLCQF